MRAAVLAVAAELPVEAVVPPVVDREADGEALPRVVVPGADAEALLLEEDAVGLRPGVAVVDLLRAEGVVIKVGWMNSVKV